MSAGTGIGMGQFYHTSVINLSTRQAKTIVRYGVAATATEVTTALATALVLELMVAFTRNALGPKEEFLRFDSVASSFSGHECAVIAAVLGSLALWNGCLDLLRLYVLRKTAPQPLRERPRATPMASNALFRSPQIIDDDSPILSVYMNGGWRTLARQMAAAPVDAIFLGSAMPIAVPLVRLLGGSDTLQLLLLVAIATVLVDNYRYRSGARVFAHRWLFRMLSILAIWILTRISAPHARRAGFWWHAVGVGLSLALGFGALYFMRPSWSITATFLWGAWGLFLYGLIRAYSCVVFFDTTYETQLVFLVLPTAILAVSAVVPFWIFGLPWYPLQFMITVAGAIVFGWSLGGIILQRAIPGDFPLLSPPLFFLPWYPSLLRALRARSRNPISRVLLAAVERLHWGDERGALVLAACIKCDLGDYPGVLTIAQVARDQHLYGKTIQSFEILANIRLGNLEFAADELEICLRDSPDDPYFLHDKANLLWHQGNISAALTVARKAVDRGDRIPQLRQRIAMLRLLAELSCEQVLRTPSMQRVQREEYINEAELLVTRAYGILKHEQPSRYWPTARYWPLVATAALVEICRGDLKKAVLPLLSCSAHRRDASAILRVGILSTIGTTSYLRARYALEYVKTATEGTDRRLFNSASFHLDRIHRVRFQTKAFNKLIVRFDSDPLPAEAIAKTEDAFEEARRFRREIFRLSLLDVLKMSFVPPRPRWIFDVLEGGKESRGTDRSRFEA